MHSAPSISLRCAIIEPAASSDTNRTRGHVDSVVVTYEPDLDRLAACLMSLQGQVERIVIVDNGSGPDNDPAAVAGGAELVRLGANLGIGAALNTGVARLLDKTPPADWILTLDQDSVLQDGAVGKVLDAYDQLPPSWRERCALLAMRHRPLEPPRGLWRRAERRLDLGTVGAFRVRRLAITSGNLVRTDAARVVGYDEDLFVDQVDFAYCAALGRRGYAVAELPAVLFEHRIGRATATPDGSHRSYEPGQRIYYVARNSTKLLRRRDLPLAVFVAQLGGWVRSYLMQHGAAAAPRCAAIVAVGIADGLRGRSGKRERRLFEDPAPRPTQRRLAGSDQPHSPLPSAVAKAAVIVNYNSGEALVGCVASLRANGVDRIVVVDNASTDGSIELLQGEDARAEVVATGANLGFGGGVNRGLALVAEPVVLVCNPDVVLERGAVDTLVGTLVGDPSLALAGPRLVDAEGRTVQSARAFPTVGRSTVQAFAGVLRPSGRLSRRYQGANRELARTGRVDWVTGACFAARSDALRAVGGFDEGYFLYVEEVDLCWRLAAAGWGVAYEPAAKAMHIGGHSAKARPYKMIVEHHKSLWRFAKRTTTGPARLALPVVAAGIGVRCLLALARRARPGRDTSVED